VDVEDTIKFWVDAMKTHVDRQYVSGSMVYTRVTFPGDFVGLRFEYSKANEATLSPHLSSNSAMHTHTPMQDVQRATKAAFMGNSTQAETVVVFVDSVKEYLERMKDLGFEQNIYLGESVANEWVKVASLLDPNGIHAHALTYAYTHIYIYIYTYM
jgi:hypothetical protein